MLLEDVIKKQWTISQSSKIWFDLYNEKCIKNKSPLDKVTPCGFCWSKCYHDCDVNTVRVCVRLKKKPNRRSRTWTTWSALSVRQKWATTLCSAAAFSCRAAGTETCCCRTLEPNTAAFPKPAASSMCWRSSSASRLWSRHSETCVHVRSTLLSLWAQEFDWRSVRILTVQWGGVACRGQRGNEMWTICGHSYCTLSIALNSWLWIHFAQLCSFRMSVKHPIK